MAYVRAKIKKPLFVVGFWLGLWQTREIHLCGRPLVRARAKIEKDTFVVGLWLWPGKKKREDALCGRPLVRVRQK